MKVRMILFYTTLTIFQVHHGGGGTTMGCVGKDDVLAL